MPHKSVLDELKIDRSQPAQGRSAVIWFLIVLLIAGASSGYWWFSRSQVISVRTAPAIAAATSASKLTVLNASGYVVARRQATVSAKVTGKVIEVLVEEGKRVSAGQILARLDDANVRAGLQLVEAELAAAKSALAETEVRLAEAGKELQRASDLHTAGINTQADLDRAQADTKALQARIEKQRSDITVAQRQVEVWQRQLDDFVIRAPFDGIVVSKDAQPGEMVSPVSAGGGFTRTGICSLVDMTSLEVEVDVNESYINRVEPGQPVEAALDAYPDSKMAAKVIAIIPTADRQKATVKVRVGFDRLDARVLPQMGVKVAFRGGTDTAPAALTTARAITIPKAAVQQDAGRSIVFVVQAGRVERRAITITATQDEVVTLASGLSEGEHVVVADLDKLSDGLRVKETKP